MHQPFRIHPRNPKLFEFRSKPRVLICATEHYGAVVNRPFDFERYLADAAEKGQTLTRLFPLFRALQGCNDPYSTCKAETPDYIAPFRRVGPKRALDGEPQYDLRQWNPEFFDRLHRFLSLASEYGIVVEVTLLSNTYSDALWMLNPLHAKNNVNGLKLVEWPDYNSQRHADLFEWQCTYIRKMVEETNRYDNVFYEICNEPCGSPSQKPGAFSPAEVNDWQRAIAKVIRQTDPQKHLIAGQEATTAEPLDKPTTSVPTVTFQGALYHFEHPADRAFHELPFDVVNMHPLPNISYGGKLYNMGEFMMKELKLRAVRDFCLATYAIPRPLNYDEDNSATQYKDVDGWTVQRKRAWTTLFSGGHYDMIDFSITIYTPTGTSESQRCIRTWMKHLSAFIHSVDLVRARPLPDLLREKPGATLESVLAVTGEDYCIYLADERELDEPGAGEPISGNIVLNLPAGKFSMSCFSPVSGSYSPAIDLSGGKNLRVSLPEFRDDIVVRFRRVTS